MSAAAPRPTRQLWHGGAGIGDGWAMFEGRVGDNRPHRHHALQLVIAHPEPVPVWVDGHGQSLTSGLLIATDRAHRLLPGPARLLFIDRESAAGRALTLRCSQGIRRLTDTEVRAVQATWPKAPDGSLAPLLAVFGVESHTCPPPTLESDRVARVLSTLPARLEEVLSLDRLAHAAALSASRFRQRARAQVGMPLRPYLRWLRLQRALAFAATGRSLTHAAADAGFSDAAHLTRTMQAHFGVAPSDILPALRPG